MKDLEIQEQAEKILQEKSVNYMQNLPHPITITHAKAFYDGAKWMQEQDEWISVEDRLPDEGVNVLVFGEQMGSNPRMGGAYAFITQRMKLSYQKHNLHLKNQFDENDFRRVQYVTHWMPLPSPPKTK